MHSSFGKTRAPKPKDYVIGDGYTYRVNPDGSILILASPRGGQGKTVTMDKHPKAWTAIMAQIEALKAGRRDEAIRLGTQVGTLVITEVIKGVTRNGAGKRRRVREAMQDSMPDPVLLDPAPTFPWQPIAIIGGGIVLLTLITRR